MSDQPGPSRNLPSPPKRRQRLGHLSHDEKRTIVNMYKTLTLQTPRKGTTAVVINICGTLIYRTIREYQRTGQLARPKARTGRHSKLQAYDESVKNGVRQIVHSFFLKNELPTLNKIMAEITRRGEPVPHMSRTTLYRFLKLINFKYACLTEKCEEWCTTDSAQFLFKKRTSNS
ncbi:hypothetical protein QE152_g37083 [Popillia japonica]|uniref:Transposase n=1 Tax=Popillia japonica TaxID=7064 RepID=A0AAW1IBM1_POPJA